MKRLTALTLALVLTLVLTGATALSHHQEEDEPGWNCLISGNGVCGTAPHILGYIL